MEHTQGKVKIVYKPLNPAYIHIGVHKIAQMSSTGTLSREQQDANAERIKTCLLEYDTLKAKADLSQRFVWLWNEMRSGYDAGITFKHMDKFEALVKQVEALT